MNFERFWQKYSKNVDIFSSHEEVARNSWEAGKDSYKNEVLKILKSKNNNNWYESLEEIEKL